MKKSIKWLLLILVVLCVAAFVMFYMYSQNSRDHTAPVISMEGDMLSLSVYDTQDAFLTGVSALDDRDGDVSELVVVESVSAVDENHCATVTYAAFDRSGNVAKAERTVAYTDYEGPKFGLTTALVFRSGYNFDLFDYVVANDPIDGELTERIKATLVSAESDIRKEGIHQVDLRVTNSMGDTARLTVPVEVYDPSEYNGTVNLSDYLIYLEKGGTFSAEDYLEDLYADYRTILPEQLNAGGAQIDIRSDVQTNVPGTYSVTYTVTYGIYTGYTRLIVVVEE